MNDRPAPSAAVSVVDPSQVGDARRVATAVATAAGLGPTDVARAALVATEAGTNLLKHARAGELLFRPLGDEEGGGIEILSLDAGPGMADVARCMEDGYSTAGSAGQGLGAIRRASAQFDVDSRVGLGTIWAARIRPAGPGPAAHVGAVSVALAGQTACGDAWKIVRLPDKCVVMVADGLGHGPHAAEAAAVAVRLVVEHAAAPLTEQIRLLHAGLRPTRGAAVAIAHLPHGEPVIRYAGVGNVAGCILPGAGHATNMVSHNGTLGHQLLKTQEFSYPFPAGALLVMNSDGLQTQWSLTKFPGVTTRPPAIVAGLLYRDFRRTRDDVTVLALRGAAV